MEEPFLLVAGNVQATPWDSAALGVAAYEINRLSRETLSIVSKIRGHYTIKVDPLSDKSVLHEYGFYYCDTLLEPYCDQLRFVRFDSERVAISSAYSLADLTKICHGAFAYGRFHRDFNVSKEQADRRYDRWLQKLHEEGNVLGLAYADDLVGFMAVSANRLLLHAIAPQHRGKGLAKYLWSAVCVELFDRGNTELLSSVSAANLAVVNLYGSLGFRFRNAVDVYHKLVL